MIWKALKRPHSRLRRCRARACGGTGADSGKFIDCEGIVAFCDMAMPKWQIMHLFPKEERAL